jgi:hypothetical protein
MDCNRESKKGEPVYRRAWILPEDGNPVEIHPLLIDHEEISAPVTPCHLDAEAADRVFMSSDPYHRHEVVSGAAYIFLRDGVSLESVPCEILDGIVYESVGATAIAG